MSPVRWGLHDTLVPLDSTYSSPGPNTNKIFYMLLEDSFGVKSISKYSWGLEACITNVYQLCWPMYTADLELPEDIFVIAGDRAI